ncbi:zinc knuckle-domain-containing protein [Pestalotiopsis sp. NC0098]|nr:zinc knuckle-domain-containing protein [Pestalotiopsis sp. NC0098]
MYSRRPTRGTPSTVKCQKCLKNGHYSYQCTSTVQDRPYIARPSRSQQLSNPKLVPKLTEATPPELQKKEGVADQQLAKLEAERARKGELERGDDDDDLSRGPARRGRSASYDSVSTVSTSRSLSRSPRPSPAARARDSRSPSPVRQRPRRSSSSASGYDSGRSVSPARQHGGDSPRRPYSRDSTSPQRNAGAQGGRPIRSTRRDYANDAPSRRSWSRSASPAGQRRYRSRSPAPRRHGGMPNEQRQAGRGQGRGDHSSAEVRRERSLSPFSKRQALTQSMGRGR